MRQRLIDWWRGYTTDDVWSLYQKLEATLGDPIGSWVPLTYGEQKALQAGRVVRITPDGWLIAP